MLSILPNSESTNMLSAVLTLVLSICFQNILAMSNLSEADVILNPINLSEVRFKISGQPNLKVGQILSKFKNYNQNPEEFGTYFEGDILHPTAGLLKNGLIRQSLRWKNGIVPVEVRGEFNPKELNVINAAFEVYHKFTCIKFIQHSTETDYILISNKPTGCWSSLGRIGGQQIVNLQSPMCLYKLGTPLHELMHVLGFNHEHTREDRDQYVEINWKNIPTETYGNFGKALPNTTNDFKVEYDYGSVLHYSPYAFAVDSSKPTIRALKKTRVDGMGQREGFSKSDIEKIWRMYKCTSTSQLRMDMMVQYN